MSQDTTEAAAAQPPATAARGAPPRVSLGVPVYNGERFLAEALDSLLAQTYADFELIVVDNASTDHTGEICRAYAARDSRVRYYRNEANLGAARNFNRAFELARGEYFKWLAADDLCAPELLERCVQALDRDPRAVLAYPLARCIDENSKILHSYEGALCHGPWSRRATTRFRQLAEELFVSGGVSAPIYVFGLLRAELLRRTRLHGSYIASDWVLLAELALLGHFIELPHYLTLIRAHPGSSSLGARRGQWGTVAAFFDPRARGRLAVTVSTARRFAEFFVVILRAPLPRRERAALLLYNGLVTLRRAMRRLYWYATGSGPWRAQQGAPHGGI